MSKQQKQFGTWSSPFSPQLMASGDSFKSVQWDDETGALVWLENGILRAQMGVDAPHNLTDDKMSVRGRAGAGYGGGEFTVVGGVAYFGGNGGRLYRRALTGGRSRPITPGFGGLCSPDASGDGQWVAFIHTYEDQDIIAVVDTEGKQWPRKLISGADFYMQPQWHPKGSYLAYIAWDHPQMPWDGTELHLAKLDYAHDRSPHIQEDNVIAGNTETAIFQPEFSPDGRFLAYISDETGFGQLYVYDLERQTHTQLTTVEAEHGTPAWVQGISVYGWSSDSKRLFFLRIKNAISTVHEFHLETATERQISQLHHYTGIERLVVSKDDQLALIASSSKQPTRLITYHLDAGQRVYARSDMESLSADDMAEGHPISWNGVDGETVHGLYYAPTNSRFEDTGAPPLVILVHGGPTSHRLAGFDKDVNFFTTRGLAVLNLNHRGSTTYGRDYMTRLYGDWGIVDVDDAVSGAKHLAAHAKADLNKVVISGGSAGGFTVLQALIRYPGVFKAGVCKYGVADQFLMAQETHKFEARYNDYLLGPLPEAADLYRERSPAFHADKIVDPIIIFQGSDDEVVPQNQSDAIVSVLRSSGVPHEYHVYEGEGHGFRKPETIADYYTKVMKFLTKYVIYA